MPRRRVPSTASAALTRAQVRVVMGKEPSHLVRLFKGKMVVHKGGKASGFKNRTECDEYDLDGVSLFHVKGTTELNTVAVQVEEEAKNLNSGDCFVLLTPETMLCWYGGASSDGERATARGVAELLKDNPPIKEGAVRDVRELNEGEEDDAADDAIEALDALEAADWLTRRGDASALSLIHI